MTVDMFILACVLAGEKHKSEDEVDKMLERFCIMTVDGGLSDEEALKHLGITEAEYRGKDL